MLKMTRLEYESDSKTRQPTHQGAGARRGSLAGVWLLQRQRQHQRLHQPLRPLSHNANPRDGDRAHSSADLVH
jgi:hypothetical protein